MLDFYFRWNITWQTYDNSSSFFITVKFQADLQQENKSQLQGFIRFLHAVFEAKFTSCLCIWVYTHANIYI